MSEYFVAQGQLAGAFTQEQTSGADCRPDSNPTNAAKLTILVNVHFRKLQRTKIEHVWLK